MDWIGGELSGNDANLSGGGLYNVGSATLTGVTVSDNVAGANGGEIASGGGIASKDAVLTLSGGTIEGNTAALVGGGVWLDGGSASISDSLIASNGATAGAGVLAHLTTLTITNSVIRNNAGVRAGGIQTSASLRIVGSTVTGNTASDEGGGIVVTASTTRLTDTVLSQNTAEGRGGGLLVAGGIVTMHAGAVTGNRSVKSIGGGIAVDAGAELEISGATVASNVATEGAGILSNGTLRMSQTMVTANVVDVSGADTTVFSLGNGGGLLLQSGGFAVIENGSVIRDNVAGTGGGGIVTFAPLTIIDSTVSGNTSSSGGGGIFVSAGATTLTRTVVADNTSGSGGGGLLVFADTLTITDSSVTGNTASGEGGGIAVGATTALEMRGTTIAANSAAAGGGIHLRGPAVIVDSTLSGNRADVGGGGGIRLVDATATITNSTISGNTTAEAGGGIETVLTATVTLLNSTVANNEAISGGGIAQLGASAQMRNTIVAANLPADCLGTLISVGSNLDSDDSCSLVAVTDIPGVDARLGPLADNGGPTETHALRIGSPAIDAGNDAIAPATDQRGLPRLGPSDIGAFESQAVTTEVTQLLSPGFTALVFPGLDGTSAADIAAAMDPDLDAIFIFDAADQIYRVYRPDAPIAALNTLTTVNQREVIFVSIGGVVGGTFTWPDLLPGGEVELPLPPGFSFVGFTGANGSVLAALLMEDVLLSALFRFEVSSQTWLTNRPGQPAFLSNFTTVDRLTGLFVLNETGTALTWGWDEVGGAP